MMAFTDEAAEVRSMSTTSSCAWFAATGLLTGRDALEAWSVLLDWAQRVLVRTNIMLTWIRTGRASASARVLADASLRALCY